MSDIAKKTGAIQTIDATPMAMIQAAIQQGTPVEQLGALFDLQQRWEADQARKAFNRAVAAFKANPPAIFKTHTVAFSGTSYKHAALDDIVSKVTPALCAHGLSVRWEVDQGEQIAVSCILSHVDGHSESVRMAGPPDASGSKNKIQQVGSTVSYLQRYTLMSILGLAAKDIDDDGRMAGSESNKITDEQASTIEAFISENELDRINVMAYLKSKGYEQLTDLPAGQYTAFMATLKRSVKK